MIKKCLLALIFAILVAFGVLTIPKTSSQEKTSDDAILAETEGVQTMVEPQKPIKQTLHPIMKPICACESAGRPDAEPRHYESDGVTVRYGRINKLDTGMCQINLYYHEATAQKMGLDLFKENDNIAYANWLYKNEGTTPWNWSKDCWGDTVHTLLHN